jgi:hypothetical protein
MIDLRKMVILRQEEAFGHPKGETESRHHRRGLWGALGRRTFRGFSAWVMWLIIHLFNLIGFRNRLMVLTNWAWDYLLYERVLRYVFPSNLPSSSKCSSCRSLTGDGPPSVLTNPP